MFRRPTFADKRASASEPEETLLALRVVRFTPLIAGMFASVVTLLPADLVTSPVSAAVLAAGSVPVIVEVPSATVNPAPVAPTVSVPVPVIDEFTTELLSVVPVNVPAAAVTVIGAVPSKFTPLIARAVCSAVAVPALPVMVVWSPVFVPLLVPDPVNEVSDVVPEFENEPEMVGCFPFNAD